MKVRFGSIITDARGKLGGHSYARSQYGNYVRNNTAQKRTNTRNQAGFRNIFARVSYIWEQLTAQQRLAWQVYGSSIQKTSNTGHVYTLTGRQAFFRINTRSLQVNPNPIENPPQVGANITLDINVVNAVQSPPNVTITLDSNISQGRAFLWIAPYLGKLETPNRSKFIPLTKSQNYTSGAEYDMHDMIIDKFPNNVLAHRFAIGAQVFDHPSRLSKFRFDYSN